MSGMMIAQALATFQGVLKDRLGEKVDLVIVQAFATLVTDIIKAIHYSPSE